MRLSPRMNWCYPSVRLFLYSAQPIGELMPLAPIIDILFIKHLYCSQVPITQLISTLLLTALLKPNFVHVLIHQWETKCERLPTTSSALWH